MNDIEIPLEELTDSQVPFWTAAEVCAIFRIGPRTLFRMERVEGFPVHMLTPGTKRYSPAEIREWLRHRCTDPEHCQGLAS